MSHAQESVWEDIDDEELAIDLSETDRLKKLRRQEGNTLQNMVSGSELSSLLKDRYVLLL